MSKLTKVSLTLWAVWLAGLVFVPLAFADDNTSVNVPVGDWAAGLVAVAVGVVAPAIWRIAGPLAGVLKMMRVEQLLEKSLLSALESKGIRPGVVMTVDLKNELVAEAARYAIRNGPEALIKWIGGADGLYEKLRARLPGILKG